jgi:hypothetical protein
MIPVLKWSPGFSHCNCMQCTSHLVFQSGLMPRTTIRDLKVVCAPIFRIFFIFYVPGCMVNMVCFMTYLLTEICSWLSLNEYYVYEFLWVSTFSMFETLRRAYWVRCFRPSAWSNSRTAEWNFMKFDNGDFFFQIWLKSYKNNGHST